MKGLAQANILRSNNTTETGYGIAYANEISGHRSVANLTALYALYDWQLSASGDNTGNDAIGQLWYVVTVDSDGSGCFYQLKSWESRHEANGWEKYSTGETPDLSQYATKDYVTKNSVMKAEVTEVTDEEINNIWNKII